MIWFALIGLPVFILILAISASQIIFWLVLFAWGGLGASIGPTVILSLFWKRTTKWGVVTGLVSGTLVTIIWNQTPALKGIIYELVPAFIISTLLTIIVSLFTTPPPGAAQDLELIAAKYRNKRKI